MKATDEEINAAIELLRGEGFTVERPEWGPWETPKALFERLDLDIGTGGFFVRLYNFPGAYPKQRGPSGRCRLLRAWHGGERSDLKHREAVC